MTNDETSRLKAVAQQQESILIGGMIGIVNQTGALVQKDRLRLFEGHTVLGHVCSCLAAIPGTFYIAHSIMVALRATNAPCGQSLLSRESCGVGTAILGAQVGRWLPGMDSNHNDRGPNEISKLLTSKVLRYTTITRNTRTCRVLGALGRCKGRCHHSLHAAINTFFSFVRATSLRNNPNGSESLSLAPARRASEYRQFRFCRLHDAPAQQTALRGNEYASRHVAPVSSCNSLHSG